MKSFLIGTLKVLEKVFLATAIICLLAVSAVVVNFYLAKANRAAVSARQQQQEIITVTPIDQAAPTNQVRILPVMPAPEVVFLNEADSVVMDQAFDSNSVSKVMREMQALSDKLPKSATITLVLNSPGGSVPAGQKLITFSKGLPQKVRTLTIFAASMGFQTVQGITGERLVLEHGTLMSHPASFGVDGQTPYQVKSRLNWIMQMVDSLDRTAAARMGMGFYDYQNLIHDEFWTFGQDAVRTKAADRVVIGACGKYKENSKTIKVETFFGDFDVELPSCPLIPGYISVKPSGGGETNKDALDYVKSLMTDRHQFTRDYIVTNKFYKFQAAE